MLKRLPYIFLAVAIAVYFSAQGFIVSAASPIFYDGVVSYNIARRSFYDSVDFNYVSQQYDLPFLNDVGIIDSNAWGLPAAFSETTYTNVPGYISVSSPDLMRNGGYVYCSFMFAYFNGTGISNFDFNTARRGDVYIYSAGSFDRAKTQGTHFSTTQMRNAPNANTKLINPAPAATGNEVVHVTELNMPSGVNFPSTAIFDLDDDKGTLNAYGLTDAYFLGYGETADSNWIKTNVVTVRWQVSPSSANFDYVCYFDISDMIHGSFTPVAFNNYNLQTNAGIYFIQSTLSGSQCNLIYICPVSCFAVSTSSYLDIEEYLANISNQISNISGGNVPQSVLESYAALGSEAREAAHSAAQAMEQVYPTYDPSAMDVSNLMDPTAKSQFNAILSPIWNSKILPIIGAVFTLVLIGFVFFGKK